MLLIAFLELPKTDEKAAVAIESKEEINYEKKIEERLESFLSEIEGVGNLEAMVSLESGKEYVYATEGKYSTDEQQNKDAQMTMKTQKKSDTDKKYLLVADGQGKERPIVLKEIEPKVGAVAIICDGGDNNEVKLKLTLTVSTLFDIPSHKITITKRMIGR